MTERLPYEVISSEDGLEVRHYPAYVLVQVEERGDFESAGSRGFRPLFNYIAGVNASQQKIAMTAPVIQEQISPAEHAVSFVMPKGFTLDSLPAPSAAGVSIVPVDEHFAAAIKFTGSWNNERFAKKGEELLAAVKSAGLETVGSLYWARFDPPFKPGFLKHNEVLIKIKEPNKGNK